MWYHTDVNDRILEDRPVPFSRRGPSAEEQERSMDVDNRSFFRNAYAAAAGPAAECDCCEEGEGEFERGSLQTAAVMAALSARINFFRAETIPNK